MSQQMPPGGAPPQPPYSPQPGFQSPGAPQKSGLSGWTIALIVGAVGCLPAVAIVGILAAISIPNFLKFQCKSKQSEAKTNLSGIFTSEKAAFGEFGAYSTDLVAINWYPDGAPLYVYGFTEPGESGPEIAEMIEGYDNSRTDTLNPAVQMDAGGIARYSTQMMVTTDGGPLRLAKVTCSRVGATPYDGPCGIEAGQPAFGFLAGAVGDVDTDRSSGVREWDHWDINAQRVLTPTVDDCAD